MDYYVYIIYSSSRDKYYTGYSEDPDERLIKHNLGATISTRTGKPWTLVYKEKCINKSTAIRRENQIKKMKSRKYIESLIKSDGPDDMTGMVRCQDADRKRQH
ncbi:MAG TPA: GIY-YIG nuclease family protein [Bacteroidales bacterium]|nr:GIY-YIG nuclease family protein [Bacteroidales bacterium]